MADASSCITGHTVGVYDRGAKRLVVPLADISELTWSRKKDAVSSASLTISGQACSEQKSAIDSIEAKRHELVVYRNKDRVWEGPIETVSSFSDRVKISAKDPWQYLFGTPMTKDWPSPDGGGPPLMTDRIDEIITHELTQPYQMSVLGGVVTVERWETLDTPANVLPFLEVRPGTVLTFSSTLAFELTVGEHLQNLSRGGLDWTAVGRRLIIWDSENALGKTRTLSESDFYGEIEVISSGADFASVAHVSAQRPEVAPAAGVGEVIGVGNAGATDQYYGPWTKIASLMSEEGSDSPTQLALNSQARRELSGRNPLPLEIRLPSGGLRLSYDLTINDLVPGTLVPVLAALNLRKVSQNQILSGMTVNETPGSETITVELEPAGPVVVI